MRLGVVLTGNGVFGAAGVGVMEELMRRQIEPYAVCGLGTGAWPAALFAVGADAGQMGAAAQQAARMGRRLVRKGASCQALLRGKKPALYTAPGLERLLTAQTGGRILALCPRRAIFPLKAARMGHEIVFSSKSFPAQKGAMVTMQASVSFAARAAMGLPPFLQPMDWMGSPLLPTGDEAAAARHLLAMGAQRVLIVEMRASPRRVPDALDLAALCMSQPGREELPQGCARLRIAAPDSAGAFSLEEILPCVQTGKKTAERELDLLFEQMGMAFCRILPFRRSGSV